MSKQLVAAVTITVLLRLASANDQLSNQLSIIGCAANCVYRPTNMVQAHACGSLGLLKNQLHLQFECATHDDQKTCEENSSRDKNKCVWVETPDSLISRYGVGACLAYKVAKVKDSVLIGMQMLSDAYPNAPIPTTRNLNRCLELSNTTQVKCRERSDYGGQPCEWCEDISSKYYPVDPPITNICIQQNLMPGVCNELKANAPLALCPVNEAATEKEEKEEEEEEMIGERRSRRRAKPKDDGPNPSDDTPNRPTDKATSWGLSAAIISCFMSLYASLMLHA